MKKEIDYDYNTRNKNFIRLSDRMEKKGIKNHLFHLTLLDRDLSGVDPFNPKLSAFMKHKIFKECINNYWYFIRECIKVEKDEVDNNGLYSLYEAPLKVHYGMHNNINIITDIPYISEDINIRLLWEFLFNKRLDISLIDKSLRESKETLNEIRKLYNRLPNYIKGNLKNNIDNQDRIENIITGNRITTKPGIKTIYNADTLGRGITQPRQWYRNIADINYIELIFDSSRAGFHVARENAMKNGINNGTILTSHPYISLDKNKIDSYNFELKIKEFSANCPYFLFDMSKDALKMYLENNTINDFMFISKYQD